MSKSKPKLLTTWCGSQTTLDNMPAVLRGWQSYARRLERQLSRLRSPRLKPQSLEFQLCEVLSSRCGERGQTEGAVDTLCRIIAERDDAMRAIALDRLLAFRNAQKFW